MFKKYVSNVPLGTGTNFILEGRRHIRLRAYLPVETPGEFDWRIFYINTVNSTFADGSVAYVDRSGGSFCILSAKLADGGVYGKHDLASEPDWQTLTFNGSGSVEVAPDEHIESDPVRLRIEKGHSLAFEWELEGEDIPCTPDSQAFTFEYGEQGFRPADNSPLPAMFACDRPYKKRVAFLGDSITQGCGTARGAVEMWAGRIAMMLDGYAVWNLGLGYGRGADCAAGKSWLWKAKQNDVVVMTFGVNDILHGAYRAGHRSSAGEVDDMLERLIRELQSAGVEVILSMIPPFEFTREQYIEWRAAELSIPRIAELYGCRVYDIESALDGGEYLSDNYIYGAHPDGRGGLAAAEKFRNTFFRNGDWSI